MKGDFLRGLIRSLAVFGMFVVAVVIVVAVLIVWPKR